MLLSVAVLSACSNEATKGNEEAEEVGPEYSIERFNALATNFHLDSVREEGNKFAFYFTDTLSFYQPTIHAQNYSLALLMAYDPKTIPLTVDSVLMHVNMPNRDVGDISVPLQYNDMMDKIDKLSVPEIRSKIIALNQLNKKYFLKRDPNKSLQPIYELNMFFAQTLDPTSWVGIDSYWVIWEYESNKSRNQSIDGHLDLFNQMLTDTLYMKDKVVAREIHEILVP